MRIALLAAAAVIAAPGVASASHEPGGIYEGRVTPGAGATVTLEVSGDGSTVDIDFQGLSHPNPANMCTGVGFSADDVPIAKHAFTHSANTGQVTANGSFGKSFVSGAAQVLTNPCTTGSKSWRVAGPDGFLETEIQGDFLGLNVLNATGEDQTRQLSAKRGRTTKFDLGVANQGIESADFRIKGCRSSKGFKVTYLDDTGNVTGAVTDGTYETDTIASSEIAADFHSLDLKIKALDSAEPGKTKTCKVTSDSGLLIDVIKAKLKVKSG